MRFTELEFWAFLALVWVVYYLPWMKNHQVKVLLLASLAFYSWEDSHYLLLLALSAGFSALCSGRIEKTGSRAWLWLGVAGNLLVLVAFKYATLLFPEVFTNSLQAARASDLTYLPLPVGVSFFTFQGISLVVDASSGKTPRSGFTERAFYIAFFPQLVAGPIVRGAQFLAQIEAKTPANIAWTVHYRQLVLGMFLKRVVADNLATVTYWIRYPEFGFLPGPDLVGYLFAYSIRIFADFAGYSLLAMGLAGLFGYRLPENFRHPYLSRSFSEFWRRWHITLSQWLRDYLYIPLGGNRHGLFRTYLNLMLVMTLGGLWHGASWNYLVWGFAHGLFLVAERPFLKGSRRGFSALLGWFAVFSLVSLAWLLFVLPTPGQAWAYLQAIHGNFALSPDLAELCLIAYFTLPVVLYHLFSMRPGLKERFAPYAYGVMLFLLVTEREAPSDFIYFRF